MSVKLWLTNDSGIFPSSHILFNKFFAFLLERNTCKCSTTQIYAHTRIFIRVHVYTRIHARKNAYTFASDVSLLFNTIIFICVSLLCKRKKKPEKATSRQRKIYKLQEVSRYKHARRIASCIYWIKSSSSRFVWSLAVDESEGKGNCHLNSAFKLVYHSANYQANTLPNNKFWVCRSGL